MPLPLNIWLIIYSGDETHQFSAAHRLRVEKCEPKESLAALSEPKPDIWFAFPIDHDPDSRDEYFSFKILKKLEDKIGLVSCPLMSLEKYGSNFGQLSGPRQIDDRLVCFPFLLIEVKKNNPEESELCYCQAANNCGASLSLLEHLAIPWEQNSVEEMLPVVAFTFVGPEAKMWLTFNHELSYTDQSKTKWRSNHVSSKSKKPVIKLMFCT